METLNVSTTNHSEGFQVGLMTAILNSFDIFENGKIDLEHADNFDEILAESSELDRYLIEAPAYELAVDELQQKDGAARAIIQERFSAPIPPLEILLKLPKDSLGYVYASSLQALGLKPLDTEPSLFSWERVNSDVTYVEYRYQITHDLWHIVTGFDTTPLGELGLQAFYLAQFRLPGSLVALVGGLIGFMVSSPESLPILMETIERGWQMGKIAKQLIAQKWEESWDKPVSQWQTELNIQLVN